MANIFDEKSILNRNKIYEVPTDTVILKEGEINLDMYKIVSGHVEMYTGYGTPNEVLIGLLGPGTCFGEFGILTGQPAIYTIITYSKTRIIRVTEGLMGQFIQENKEDIMQIMRNMATSMTRMQHQINQLSKELENLTELNKSLNTDTSNEVHIVNDLKKENLKNYVLKENTKAKMHFFGRTR